ncbi:hypothetical protein VTJ49DRAFT_2195 [Mycothermus thermophilus]|uniref:Patatin-like phospholipase domain-containing protein n=1 Tax=Humicola insolens TaxID=85995 RepID=A0ABR3VB73_HUMIN
MTIPEMPELLVHNPLADPKPRRKKKCRACDGSPVSRLVHGAGNAVLSLRGGVPESDRADRRTDEHQLALEGRMLNAKTLDEWEAAAKELDEFEGNDAWKLDDDTGEAEYRPDLIRAKLQALDAARANCDINGMMYLIRTALSRDVGGMGSTELYLRSYIGTKALIERYVQSAVDTIDAVVDLGMRRTDVDPRDLLEGMVYARQSFGRSAVLLSGGATFGMAHIGVLKTLFEQNLLPRIISGASAGSIVCAVVCTRKDEELPSLVSTFEYGDMDVFSSDGETMIDHIRGLLTRGSWADINHLTRVMRSWLGDITFREAYNRTRRICNICVSSASMYDVPRLLNYVTAPNVLIWSAVAASCSVPLVFQGHPLLMKHPETGALEPWIPTPQQLIDGSVDNDLPMTRLAEMFNVNHFIVSQVNPHVVPFLAKDEQVVPGQLHQKQTRQSHNDRIESLASIIKEEGLYRMQFLAELGIFPNLLTKLLSVISQKYSGDINILPEITLSDVPLMLKNPTVDFLRRHCLIGERATWPKMSRIRHRLAIELALDKAVHALRTRVVFSKSQVDLRRALGVPGPLVLRGMPNHHYHYQNGDTTAPDTPWAMGSATAYSATQPPSVAGMSPVEVRASIDRRRGSGASIQLAAARHAGPFFRESESESDEEENEGRLELTMRSLGRQDKGSGFDRRPGTVHDGRKAPRLKRNAKSHMQMRAGRPVESIASSDFLLGREPLPLVEGALPAGPTTTATYGCFVEDFNTRVGTEEQSESQSQSQCWDDPTQSQIQSPSSQTQTPTMVESLIPAPSLTLAAEGGGIGGAGGEESASQASDGGLVSDADPYAAGAASVAGNRKGQGLLRRASQSQSHSKLRCSVP